MNACVEALGIACRAACTGSCNNCEIPKQRSVRFAWQMYEAALESGDDGLGAILDLETKKNDADVRFDGGFGDAERGGDSLVAVALDEKLEHLALTRA